MKRQDNYWLIPFYVASLILMYMGLVFFGIEFEYISQTPPLLSSSLQFECGEYENETKRWLIWQEVPECTNNLSIATCNGSPEDCNERYDLDVTTSNCYNICYDQLESNSICGGECHVFFRCVEWTDEFGIKESLYEIQEFCETTPFPEDCVWDFSKHGDDELCTRSELRCQGSVEECEGRYS